MSITEKDLKEFFTYHAPVADQVGRYETIRSAAYEFAKVLIANTNPSADQTAAIRKLRECVMTANASIALEFHEASKKVLPFRRPETQGPDDQPPRGA